MPRPMLLDGIRCGRIANWSCDSLDCSQRRVEALIASALRHPPAAGEIVRMHDDSALSPRLLQALLPARAANGFAYEALPPA